MTKENKFKIGLCLQEIALSMDDATLEKNRERLKLIEDIIAGEQEPCSDAVSRQYLLDNCVVDKVTMPYVPINRIENAPSVKPQDQTGHWIEKEDFNMDTYYDCSECGESFCLIDGTPTDNLYNFCPNCGAKMFESQESEETEVWNSIHGQVTAPKGTFERIYNEAKEDENEYEI